MHNYLLLTMLLVSTSIFGAQSSHDRTIRFLMKKCALFSAQQGVTFVGEAAEIFKPSPAFEKTITPTGAVHYVFDGTLPECLMGFLFFKNQEGKIERSKAIRADQRNVENFVARLNELLRANVDASKQILFVASQKNKANPLLLNLSNHSYNNTTMQSYYYSKDIVHPAGYVECDGNSVTYEVREALETADIQEELDTIAQN